MSGHDFYKMHGLGNDFVVFDGRAESVALDADQVRALADRRRGIGCDQVVVMEPPRVDTADVFMRLFNSDGHEVSACGNATRCVARLIMGERGDMGPVTVATRAALLRCWVADGSDVAVAMGEPREAWQAIPLADRRDVTALEPAAAQGLGPGRAVNLGNPHVVFFVNDPDAVDLATIGPAIEHDPMFLEGVNVSVAKVAGPAHLAVRVWERGAGLTLACGTAACAAAVTAIQAGHVTGPKVAVTLPGGTLDISWGADNHITMAGPTAWPFAGVLGPALLAIENTA